MLGLAFDLGADGSQGEALTIPASGSLHPVTEERLRARENFIHMDGKAVFRFAVTVMGKTVETSLARAAGLGVRLGPSRDFRPLIWAAR